MIACGAAHAVSSLGRDLSPSGRFRSLKNRIEGSKAASRDSG